MLPGEVEAPSGREDLTEVLGESVDLSSLLLNSVASVIEPEELVEVKTLSSEWEDSVIESILGALPVQSFGWVSENPVPSVISDLLDVTLVSVLVPGVNTFSGGLDNLFSWDIIGVSMEILKGSFDVVIWLLEPLTIALLGDNVLVFLVENP